MATGHLDPGYENAVGRMWRAKSALHTGSARPGAKNLRELQDISMDPMQMEDIRRRAREVWLQKDCRETSYQDHYHERNSAQDEPTRSRPTSSHRRHKPHPEMIFLTTRLHHCPGYHNPDTTMGKDTYRLDASQHPMEQENRAKLRDKYVGRVSSAAKQYQTNPELDGIDDPIERQGMSAYLKLVPDKEKQNILANLSTLNGTCELNGAIERTYRPRTVPSLHRYLKEAGAEEHQKLERVNEKYFSASPGVDIVSRRLQDINNSGYNNYVHKSSKRGDFLMHPQWPPTMTHHRLNGLSSVEIPCYPGRR